MQKLNSIQALRAIAALAVFLCHLFAMEQGQAHRANKLTDFWVSGAHGVDLFFVISGFVIVWVGGAVPQNARGSVSFLYARATRIYPLWWLFACLMMLALVLLRGAPWDPLRLDHQGLDGPTHLLKSILLWPQPDHPVLGVGWTLVHEMYFYIGFSLLILVLPVRYRLHGLLAWGGLVTLGAMSGLTSAFGRNLVELIFYPMTLQFIAGGLVAYAIKAGWRRHAHTCAVIGGLGFLLSFLGYYADLNAWLMATFGVQAPFQGSMAWRRTLIYGLPAALLVYGLVALELNEKARLLIPKSLVTLGDWSYSLYLCHVLTVSVAGHLTIKVFGTDGVFAHAAYLIISTTATLSMAAISYYGFERPVISYFKARRPFSRRALNKTASSEA